MKNNKISLANSIFTLLLALGILPMISMLAVNINSMLFELENMESQYESQLLQAKTSSVEARIHAYEEIIRFISKLPSVQQILGGTIAQATTINPEKATRHYLKALNRAFEDYPDLIDVRLYNIAGKERLYAVNTHNEGFRHKKIEDHKQLQQILPNLDELSYNQVNIVMDLVDIEQSNGVDSRMILLYMVTPIIFNNVSIGTYVVTVDLGILSASFPDLYWVTSDGHYIDSTLNSPKAINDFPALTTILAEGKPAISSNNKRVAWYPLYRSDTGNFMLWVGQDIQLNSVARASEQVYVSLILTGLMIILMSTLIAALISKKINRFFSRMHYVLEAAIFKPAKRETLPKTYFSETNHFIHKVNQLRIAHSKSDTKRTLAENALKNNEALLRTMSDAVKNSVILVDEDLIIQFINPATQSLYGVTSDDVLHQPVDKLFHTSSAEREIVETVKACLCKEVPCNSAKNIETNMRYQDRSFTLELTFSKVTQNERNCVVIVATDITDRKIREEQLIKLADTDPLTGISNRRGFDILAQKKIEMSQVSQRQLYLIMFDLDNFKLINDEYGHAAGDKVIQLFADECRKKLRDSDILSRFGGEEFAAIISVKDRDEAINISNRICKSIAKCEIRTDEFHIPINRITVSIGISPLDKNIESLMPALKEADRYLYKAKTSGKNRVESAAS